LIRREYFRPQLEQLAEAATRVSPGAVFYGVMQGDRQIGFASSTLDTAAQSITLDDYLVASLPIGGKARRATARTNVTLTRALHMSKFDLSLEAEDRRYTRPASSAATAFSCCRSRRVPRSRTRSASRCPVPSSSPRQCRSRLDWANGQKSAST